MSCFAITREASPAAQGNKYRYQQPDNTQRVRNPGTLSLRWEISTKYPPQDSENQVEEEAERIKELEWIEDTKDKAFQTNRTDAHMNSATVVVFSEPAWVSIRADRRVGHMSPLLIQELSPIYKHLLAKI